MSISVSVVLLSGRTAIVDALPTSLVHEVQEEAQFQLGAGLRCLISDAGEVLPPQASLQSLGVRDGATLTAHTRAASLAATGAAFALLRSDGRVVTWGDSDRGGDSSNVREKLFAVHSLTATAFGAFAALKTDGSVVTWGNPGYGGSSDSVRARLTGVQQITASAGAFAALRADRSVVTWGHKCFGGDSRAVRGQLKDVQQIWSTACRCLAMHCAAFAALRRDGTVVTWGCAAYGGDSQAVQSQLRNVQQIEATVGAFAAQREDGSVITWGHRAFGGDSGSVQHLLKDVRQVRATLGAFAGLCADGSVVSWGLEMISGNDLPLDVLQNVKEIRVVDSVALFAAVRQDDSVVIWGDRAFGQHTYVAQADLDCLQELQVASKGAVATVLVDGSVKMRGLPDYGGDGSLVREKLKNVQHIRATAGAFAAICADGTVVAWGSAAHGGDCSAVEGRLTEDLQLSRPGLQHALCKRRRLRYKQPSL